jgi:nicotinamidase-related amidase
MAHQCVSATTRAGAELGYDISVVRDAIGDRHLPGATAEELVRVSRNMCQISK